MRALLYGSAQRLAAATERPLRAALAGLAWTLGGLVSAVLLSAALLVLAVVPEPKLAAPWALWIAPVLPLLAAVLVATRLRQWPRRLSPAYDSAPTDSAPAEPVDMARGRRAEGMMLVLTALVALLWALGRQREPARPAPAQDLRVRPVRALGPTLLSILAQVAATRVGSHLLASRRPPPTDSRH